jgi:hypothetical protein
VRGVSRFFPRRAGEASRCAPQRLAPWKRSIRRYLRAYVEGALTRLWAEKMRKPRNSINSLLAPQGLVRLFTGYHLPKRPYYQVFRRGLFFLTLFLDEV